MLSAMLSSVAANQSLTFLPEIWRFVVVQLLCFTPYGYLSLGLVFPEDLQRYVVKLYTFLFPAYRARLRPSPGLGLGVLGAVRGVLWPRGGVLGG